MTTNPLRQVTGIPDDLEALVRTTIGGEFSLIRELGRGGMGVVYLARELRLDRLVALKVLPLELGRDPVSRKRFVREARTAAQLAHPNIVPIHRADERGGLALFVMGYVDGESLGERLRQRGALSPAEVVRIVKDAALALAYAHARGVVHRDVKPENILLERATGRALVTDFGIARRSDTGASSPGLTQPHAILGTLHYMSPEQVSGAPLDGRSDLYALGVVAWEALAGRVPFAGLEGPAVMVAHATRLAPQLDSIAPNVPAGLAAVIDRCLAKDPAARYASGEALAEALANALEASPIGVRDQLPVHGAIPARLSEREAEVIWRRAAQLQADASRRLEERGDMLTRVHAREGGDHGAASSVTPIEGFALNDVVAAAREAGISAQFVAMAVAELPRAGAGGTAAHIDDAELGISERQATAFLGTLERSLAVSQVIPAPPARTLRALGTILQQTPYELRLRETVGGHPLDGGVIVFDLPGPIIGAGGASAAAMNAYWMATHQQLEARQVQVTMRGIAGDPMRTEVTMSTDLRPGVRHNVRVGQWMAGGAGAVTGGLGAAIAWKSAALVGALVAGTGIGAALGAVALTWWGYRRMYTSVLRSARREMLGSLEGVAAAVQSEAVFGQLPGPGQPVRLPGGGNDDAAAILLSMG